MSCFAPVWFCLFVGFVCLSRSPADETFPQLCSRRCVLLQGPWSRSPGQTLWNPKGAHCSSQHNLASPPVINLHEFKTLLHCGVQIVQYLCGWVLFCPFCSSISSSPQAPVTPLFHSVLGRAKIGKEEVRGLVFCVAQAGLKPARSCTLASSVQTTAPVISLPF